MGTLLNLPFPSPERSGEPADSGLLARRKGLHAAVASGTFGTDAPCEEMVIGGVRTLRFAPPSTSAAVVLHLHGGGFRMGCPEVVGRYAAALAARCGVTVLCPAYRLAPEHPFPAALNDTRSVLRAIQASCTQRIILSGDSAGAALAAIATALAVAEQRSPQALVLLSPWLDLTVTNPSYERNAATDPLFSMSAAREAAALYLQRMAADEPLASPSRAPVEGFPPTLISAGQEEVLVDDARRFADRLQAASVPTQLSILPDMEHVAVTRDLSLPGARQTFDLVADFIGKIVAMGEGDLQPDLG